MTEADSLQIWTALKALRDGRPGNQAEREIIAQPAMDLVVADLQANGFTIDEFGQLQPYTPPEPEPEPEPEPLPPENQLTGTVNTDGTQNVAWASGDKFTEEVAGKSIMISAVSYNIFQFVTDSQLFVDPNPPEANNAPYVISLAEPEAVTMSAKWVPVSTVVSASESESWRSKVPKKKK